MKGIVMDIQKFCLQDGPGIRTTVFLKGCNMKCRWCHNPESMETAPVLMYAAGKCTACRSCQAVCPNGAHRFTEEDHLIDREKCTACGACVKSCPAQALSVNGTVMRAEEVMEEICKDEKYYISSGGGVTFSGGEATQQSAFLLELLQRCGDRGYHTALETNGLVSEEHLRELAGYTDLFLFDYKVTGGAHRKWTGVPAEPVLQSLALLQERQADVVLRCPIIPGINDTEEHFQAIRELKARCSCIKQTEIMAYHDTGKGKWEECGKEYTLGHIKTASPEQKRAWEAAVRSCTGAEASMPDREKSNSGKDGT